MTAKASEVKSKIIIVVDWSKYTVFIFSLRCDYTTGSLGIFSAFYSTPETDILKKKNIKVN
jgi:hypothetical protein